MDTSLWELKTAGKERGIYKKVALPYICYVNARKDCPEQIGCWHINNPSAKFPVTCAMGREFSVKAALNAADMALKSLQDTKHAKPNI